MDYREYYFKLNGHEDFHQDLLINSLSELGFDTFEESEGGFKAYISDEKEVNKGIDELATHYSALFSFSVEVKAIPYQNWNEVWENNFEPLKINERCYVRATFHKPQPQYEFEIIVDPKMAFGTGHHQTTALIMDMMMQTDFKVQSVLDMGCGTGILAILASHLGTQSIVAIDYDAICYESTIENALLNNVKNIKPLCGSKESIPDTPFDIILANINRNILLDQMERYSEVLASKGLIFFSGFYEDPDLEIISEEASKHGLRYLGHSKKDNWVAAKFQSER
jgi:ribosomal protein L11 methyltransferase